MNTQTAEIKKKKIKKVVCMKCGCILIIKRDTVCYVENIAHCADCYQEMLKSEEEENNPPLTLLEKVKNTALTIIKHREFQAKVASLLLVALVAISKRALGAPATAEPEPKKGGSKFLMFILLLIKLIIRLYIGK